MKGKRKFVIAISVLAVALVVTLGSLIGVLAAFNASVGNGFDVSLKAGANVNAEVSCRTFRALASEWAAKDLRTYGEVVKSSDDKDFISFSQAEDQGLTASKTFENIEIDENRADATNFEIPECLYVIYTFKNTGDAETSIKIKDELTCENMSSRIQYAYDDSDVETFSGENFNNVSGDTIELAAEGSVFVLFIFTPSALTQNAGITGNLSFTLTASANV